MDSRRSNKSMGSCHLGKPGSGQVVEAMHSADAALHLDPQTHHFGVLFGLLGSHGFFLLSRLPELLKLDTAGAGRVLKLFAAFLSSQIDTFSGLNQAYRMSWFEMAKISVLPLETIFQTNADPRRIESDRKERQSSCIVIIAPVPP